MKKSSNTEAEVKKSVAYIKKHVLSKKLDHDNLEKQCILSLLDTRIR